MRRPGQGPKTWTRKTAYDHRNNGHPVYFSFEEPKSRKELASVVKHRGDQVRTTRHFAPGGAGTELVRGRL